MSIDLEKNKAHVLQVHNDVLDDKSSTDWALFGYEGQANILRVIGYGDEGLEELVDELNASKIMYAVIRIQDPKTSRMKFILLNWQGEGAPNLRKGVCARHLQDVKRMLKGIHMTVTARTEEDVDSEAILSAVAKATSTEYNFKERSELPDKNVPVKNLAKKFWSGDVCGASGTNYKRTNPQTEIDANRRNKFWEAQEAEEKVRKEEEIKKREEEAKRLEKERMERELRELKHREEINKERNSRIVAEKKAEMAAMTVGRKTEETVWKQKKEEGDAVGNQEREEEEVERARRADVMRMERKKEAESLIGHKTLQTRSLFESQTSLTQSPSYQVESKQSLSRPPPRKLKDFNPTANATELNYSTHKENSAPKKSVGSRWPPPAEEPVPEQRNKVPGKITEWKPQEIKPKSQDTQINSFQRKAPSDLKVSPTPNPLQSSTYQERLSTHTPPSGTTPNSSSPSFPPETTQSSQRPPESPSSFSLLPSHPPPSHISENGGEKELAAPFSPNGFHDPTKEGEDEEEQKEEQPRTNGTSDPGGPGPHFFGGREEPDEEDFSSVCMTYEVDGIEYQILPEHGMCARALYDYQAADDTEITFDPGDIITNIDQIDVGWWQGVSPAGVFGLFPANYVELINGAKIH